MAAVPHPAPTYRPMLPERGVAEGRLSDAQLESVVLAGQAHERHLAALYRIGSGWETVQRVDRDGDDEDGNDAAGEDEVLSEPVRFRRGWMLGDGTGCGKGRQVAAIMCDKGALVVPDFLTCMATDSSKPGNGRRRYTRVLIPSETHSVPRQAERGSGSNGQCHHMNSS